MSRQVQVTRTVRRTLPDGRVVTETFTEYRNVGDGDDSDFGNFGGSEEPSGAEEADDSSSTGDFEEDALAAHNMYRAKHGVEPLTLDRELCDYAQEWANHLASQDTFMHRPSNSYGENIYCSWSSDPNAQCSGKTPVDNWYSEIADYDFQAGPGGAVTGHFTQVVWKDSKLLGIAQARSNSGKILVVANYDPAGNFGGRYQANVFAPE